MKNKIWFFIAFVLVFTAWTWGIKQIITPKDPTLNFSKEQVFPLQLGEEEYTTDIEGAPKISGAHFISRRFYSYESICHLPQLFVKEGQLDKLGELALQSVKKNIGKEKSTYEIQLPEEWAKKYSINLVYLQWEGEAISFEDLDDTTELLFLENGTSLDKKENKQFFFEDPDQDMMIALLKKENQNRENIYIHPNPQDKRYSHVMLDPGVITVFIIQQKGQLFFKNIVEYDEDHQFSDTFRTQFIDSSCQKTLVDRHSNTAEKLFWPQSHIKISLPLVNSGADITESQLIHYNKGDRSIKDLEKYINNHTPLFSMQTNMLDRFKQKTGKAVKNYQAIPLAYTKTGSGFTRNIEKLETGYYSLLIRDSHDFLYSIPLEVSSDFSVKIKDDKKKMIYYIEEKLPLLDKNLTGQLNQILGTGNYSYHFEREIREEREDDYEDYYDYDYDYQHYRNSPLEDRVLVLEYFITPQQHYTGTLIVENIAQEKTSYPLDFFVESIPKKRVSFDLFSQDINVLPSQGYWGDKIKIWSKNLENLSFYGQKCQRNQQRTFDKTKRVAMLWEKKAMSRRFPNELYYLDCNDSIENYSIKNDNFSYWKRIDKERELPESLKTSTYFRLSAKENMEDAKFYIRSPFGIFAKVAPLRELRIWALNFKDGSPVKNAHISISDEHNSVLLAQPFDQEMISFPLPEWDNEKYQIFIKNDEGENYLIVDTGNYGDNFASFLSPHQTEQNKRGFYKNNSLRIYGYTDRTLYREGDIVHFAGFVQDVQSLIDNTKAVPEGSVNITIRNYAVEDGKAEVINIPLDTFWGFQTSFQFKKEKFWEFDVYYEFLPIASTGESEITMISTHSTLYVEDFQKKSFQLNSKKIRKGSDSYLMFSPEYYFGGKLKNYDISLEYSARQDSWCEYCRWRDSEFYYNYLFDDYSYYYGEFEQQQYSGDFVLGMANSMDLLKGKSFNLNVRTTIKDNLSNESRTDIEKFEFLPEVELGLDGYPNEWMYQDKEEDYRIKGEIKDLKESKSLSYERYYRPFDFKQERDIQGTYYYVYGDAFLPLQSGSLNIAKNFSLVPPLKEGGEYFLKVISKDKDWTINGEVHKMLTYYDKIFKGGFQGNIENSYRMKVEIDKKHYQPGSTVPVQISPYIKGAKAIITVEQSNNILYYEMKELDGSPIEISVQENFFPSAEIGVIQFVGEDINSQLGSSGEQKRTEPSFFAGYATLGIQKNLKTITTRIHTDKKSYSPWENITINIETKDYQGNPVDAKVSLAVVDKALSDIYDSIKDPIADVYHKVGSSIVNYGNWKNLYYALRTVFKEGEKGGDGGQNIRNIRKKFYDMAFWKPDIYTKGGKASVSFTLPDNLTTWIIDTVSFADQIKLGAQRAEFIVEQDFLLEANIPAYLTLGDEIILPIKVIGGEKIKKKPISLRAQLKQENGKIQDLGSQTLELNKQAKVSFKVPDDVLEDNHLSIILEAKMGTYHDAIEQIIPVRTEGLVMMQRDFSSQKEGSMSFDFEGWVKKAKLWIQLSQLPLESLFSSFEKMLGRGGSFSSYLIEETQLLLLLQELRGQGFFEKAMSDPKILNLGHRTSLILADKVEQNLNHLSARIRYDGGLNQRGNQRRYWKENYPFLDIQFYDLLLRLKKQENPFGRDLRRIEKRIQDIWIENPYLKLLSQWMNSKHHPKGAMTIPFTSSISTKKNDLAYQIIEFAILANQGKKNEAKKRLPQALALLDAGLSNAQHFESELINLKSLQAILLDGLIALQPQFWGNALEDQRSLQLVQEFLKLRDTRSLRGYDDFSNSLILQSLSKAFVYYKNNYPAENIDCSVLINQERFPLKSHTSLEQEFSIDSNAQKIAVERSCLHPVFLDLETKYILQDKSKNKNLLQGLKQLQLSVVEQEGSKIGDFLTLQGKFQAEKNLGNTTIEFFIPANIKIFEVKSPTNNDYDEKRKQLNTNSWECSPYYYEFRYDRVILYYDTLKAGIPCEISLPWVKSYEGNFTTMPSRLYETNGGDSRGRTNVLWKYIPQGKGKTNF